MICPWAFLDAMPVILPSSPAIRPVHAFATGLHGSSVIPVERHRICVWQSKRTLASFRTTAVCIHPHSTLASVCTCEARGPGSQPETCKCMKQEMRWNMCTYCHKLLLLCSGLLQWAGEGLHQKFPALCDVRLRDMAVATQDPIIRGLLPVPVCNRLVVPVPLLVLFNALPQLFWGLQRLAAFKVSASKDTVFDSR